MYKDKEAQREANKERQRRYRDKQKGVTSEGVTEKGVTKNVTPDNVTPKDRISFIQKELNDPLLIDDIEGAARIFKDRDIRYERAYMYKLWKDTGKDYIDSGTLAKLSIISQQLKQHEVLDGVFYGTIELKDIESSLVAT